MYDTKWGPFVPTLIPGPTRRPYLREWPPGRAPCRSCCPPVWPSCPGWSPRARGSSACPRPTSDSPGPWSSRRPRTREERMWSVRSRPAEEGSRGIELALLRKALGCNKWTAWHWNEFTEYSGLMVTVYEIMHHFLSSVFNMWHSTVFRKIPIYPITPLWRQEGQK